MRRRYFSNYGIIMSTFIFGMFDFIDIVLWGGEKKKKKVLLMNSQVYFTNNEGLKIDLGENFYLCSYMRTIIYHIIVERVIINWMFNLLNFGVCRREKNKYQSYVEWSLKLLSFSRNIWHATLILLSNSHIFHY